MVAGTSAACVLTLGGSFFDPYGVAVDGSGNVFVADAEKTAVEEIPASCIAGANNAGCVLPLGGGFSQPYGAAVGGSGDVFVADYLNNAVKEILAVNGAIPANNPTIVTLGGGFFEPVGVAVDRTGNVFVADTSNSGIVELQTQSANFGSVNVCPSGSTAPAPCSATQTLTFNIAAGTTIGSVNVLTQGAPNLDFQPQPNDTSTTLCTPQTYPSATTCTVDVTFAPLHPGVRTGAVQILDGSGNVLAETDTNGTGTAPAIAFSPANQFSFTGGPGFSFGQPSGLAMDGSGNLFVSDFANDAVYEMLAAGGYTTVNTLGGGFAFGGPSGVALDGAGNLFVADFYKQAVYEIPAVGEYNTVVPLAPGSTFGGLSDVALDRNGNVFVTNIAHSVYEILAAGGYTTVVRLASGFTFDVPSGLAVDGNGNVFVTDFGKVAVYEILAAGGYTTVNQLASGFGFKAPLGVAVDAAGNVFVADSDFSNVFEILAPGGYTTVMPIGTGFGSPWSITVSANGNVYVPDAGSKGSVPPSIQLIQRSLPPALSFATTSDGSTSSDSPKSVQFENIGNHPLSGTGTLSDQLDFTVVAGPDVVPDCNGILSLDPGAECNVSFSFTPLSVGPLASTLTLSDNALNGNPETQTVQLSGTATQGTQPQIRTISPTYGSPAALIRISGTNFGATQGNGDVTVGGAVSHVISWSDTLIAIQVPSRATTGNIVVTANGLSSNGVAFTFYGYPAIASISPGSGGIGTPVTITGTNLLDGGGNGVVTFNGAQAAILSQSATSILVDVPAGATTGPVSVYANGNTVKSSTNFTVTGPHISSLSPNYGAPAALIKITGLNFGSTQGNSSVTVGGAVSHVISWSDTLIAFQVPSRGATGNIVVTVGGAVSNGAAFTFYPYAAITEISPTSGPVGTAVTITGTNLLDGGGKGVVTFNGTPATILSQSGTSIQVHVPAGATTGPVSVYANGNTVKSPTNFTVIGPAISSLSPNYGAPAAVIGITGTLFGATQGNSYVTINGALCGVTAWSDTSITIRVPSNASTGNVVVRANGALSNGAPFTFYAYPVIDTVSPGSGSVGTPVTITGVNLLDGDEATVTFNGTPAAIVSDTSSQIQVNIPSGATTGRILVRVNGVTVVASTSFTISSPAS